MSIVVNQPPLGKSQAGHDVQDFPHYLLEKSTHVAHVNEETSSLYPGLALYIVIAKRKIQKI